MYNIANEEAAADYMAESNRRIPFIERMREVNPDEFTEDLERFAFYWAGTYTATLVNDKDDFLEACWEAWKWFDKSKLDEFCEHPAHQP